MVVEVVLKREVVLIALEVLEVVSHHFNSISARLALQLRLCLIMVQLRALLALLTSKRT